jgi:hypothetical protein
MFLFVFFVLILLFRFVLYLVSLCCYVFCLRLCVSSSTVFCLVSFVFCVVESQAWLIFYQVLQTTPGFWNHTQQMAEMLSNPSIILRAQTQVQLWSRMVVDCSRALEPVTSVRCVIVVFDHLPMFLCNFAWVSDALRAGHR